MINNNFCLYGGALLAPAGVSETGVSIIQMIALNAADTHDVDMYCGPEGVGGQYTCLHIRLRDIDVYIICGVEGSWRYLVPEGKDLRFDENDWNELEKIVLRMEDNEYTQIWNKFNQNRKIRAVLNVKHHTSLPKIKYSSDLKKKYIRFITPSSAQIHVYEDGRMEARRMGIDARPLTDEEFMYIQQACRKIKHLNKDIKKIWDQAIRKRNTCIKVFGIEPTLLPYIDGEGNIHIKYALQEKHYVIHQNGEILLNRNKIKPKNDKQREAQDLFRLMNRVVHMPNKKNVLLKEYPALAKIWKQVKWTREYMKAVHVDEVYELPNVDNYGKIHYRFPYGGGYNVISIDSKTGEISKVPTPHMMRVLGKRFIAAQQFNPDVYTYWKKTLKERRNVKRFGFKDPAYVPKFATSPGIITLKTPKNIKFEVYRDGKIMATESGGKERPAHRGEVRYIGRMVRMAEGLVTKKSYYPDLQGERDEESEPIGMVEVWELLLKKRKRAFYYGFPIPELVPVITDELTIYISKGKVIITKDGGIWYGSLPAIHTFQPDEDELRETIVRLKDKKMLDFFDKAMELRHEAISQGLPGPEFIPRLISISVKGTTLEGLTKNYSKFTVTARGTISIGSLPIKQDAIPGDVIQWIDKLVKPSCVDQKVRDFWLQAYAFRKCAQANGFVDPADVPTRIYHQEKFIAEAGKKFKIDDEVLIAAGNQECYIDSMGRKKLLMKAMPKLPSDPYYFRYPFIIPREEFIILDRIMRQAQKVDGQFKDFWDTAVLGRNVEYNPVIQYLLKHEKNYYAKDIMINLKPADIRKFPGSSVPAVNIQAVKKHLSSHKVKDTIYLKRGFRKSGEDKVYYLSKRKTTLTLNKINNKNAWIGDDPKHPLYEKRYSIELPSSKEIVRKKKNRRKNTLARSL